MSLFIVVSTITRHYATQIIKPTCSNSIYHLSRVFLKGFHYIYHHFLSTVQWMQIPLTSTLSDAKTPKFQEKACLKWSLDIPPWLAQLLCSSCHIFLFELHRDPFLWPSQYPGNAFQILPPGPSLLLRFCWQLLLETRTPPLIQAIKMIFRPPALIWRRSESQFCMILLWTKIPSLDS